MDVALELPVVLSHFTAKWLGVPQDEHVWPYAGHFPLLRSGLRPQNLHSSSWWFLGPFTFPLQAFDCHEYPWVSKSTSLEPCCCRFGAISLGCADVASTVRQMSTHFSYASLYSCNNFLLTALSRTAHPVLSRISWSFRAPKSQVSASALRAHIRVDRFCLFLRAIVK